MPSAPAARALSMYRFPSVVPPFIATKTEPGRTRRESYSMPVMGSAGGAGGADGGDFGDEVVPDHLVIVDGGMRDSL